MERRSKNRLLDTVPSDVNEEGFRRKESFLLSYSTLKVRETPQDRTGHVPLPFLYFLFDLRLPLSFVSYIPR